MTEKDGNPMPTNVMDVVKQFDFLSIGLGGKIHCSLTNRDIPVRMDAVQQHISSKKLKKQQEWYNADFTKYEPLIVPHKTNPKLLFCTLTHTELNRIPSQVEAHVNGKRFKRRKLEQEREKEAQAASTATASSEGEDFWALDKDKDSDEEMSGGESQEEGGEDGEDEAETEVKGERGEIVRKARTSKRNGRRNGGLREVTANSGSTNRPKQGKVFGTKSTDGDTEKGSSSVQGSASTKRKARRSEVEQSDRSKEGSGRGIGTGTSKANRKVKAAERNGAAQKGGVNHAVKKTIAGVVEGGGKGRDRSADAGKAGGPTGKVPVGVVDEGGRQVGVKGKVVSAESDVVKRSAKKHKRVKGLPKASALEGQTRNESGSSARTGSGAASEEPLPTTKRKQHAANGARPNGKKARS